MTKSYTYSENDGSGDWDLKLHEGPWLLCVSATAGQSSGGGSSSTSCHAFGFELEIWYHVVRAVVTVGVVVLLVACVLTLVTNCFKDDPGPRRRILEPLAFLGGVLAMGGVVAYDALRNDELPSTQSLEMDAFNISSPVLQGPDWKYNWAIFLTGSVAMLAVLAAIVIAVNNKEEPQRYGGAPFGREEKRGKDRDNGKSADKNGKLADKNGKSADKKDFSSAHISISAEMLTAPQGWRTKQ
nr:hypothetical protein BaRGS_005846 [Batillaria attramentaria]